MSKNRNLEVAQKLFADLTQGKVSAYEVEGSVSKMLLKLKQVRENGQRGLSIGVLDATGKQSAEEVQIAIAEVRKDATLERSIHHARHILGNMQESEKRGGHSPDYVYENIENTLRGAGVNTDIFTRDYHPTLFEIDTMLKKHEKDIAAKKASVVKAGQAR